MTKIIKIVMTLLVVIAFAVLPSITAFAGVVTPNDAEEITTTTDRITVADATTNETVSVVVELEENPNTGGKENALRGILIVTLIAALVVLIYRISG